MTADVRASFQRLKNYCEKEQFKGWDPFDGLNSRLLQSLPLIRNSNFIKLIYNIMKTFFNSFFHFSSLSYISLESLLRFDYTFEVLHVHHNRCLKWLNRRAVHPRRHLGDPKHGESCTG